MTVKELREILFELPDDLPVYYGNCSFDTCKVNSEYIYIDGKAKIVDEYVELV